MSREDVDPIEESWPKLRAELPEPRADLLRDLPARVAEQVHERRTAAMAVARPRRRPWVLGVSVAAAVAALALIVRRAEPPRRTPAPAPVFIEDAPIEELVDDLDEAALKRLIDRIAAESNGRKT